MKSILLFSIPLLFFMGCVSQSNKIEQALVLSGENRPALERVLQHYSQRPADSLKYQAALFLIENMPGHYSYDSKLLQAYWRRLDTLSGVAPYSKIAMQIIPYSYPEYQYGMTRREDVKQIQSGELIAHINQVFKQWETCRWLQGVDFETIRDYLLPYRVENEPLGYRNDSSTIFYQQLQHNLRWSENTKLNLTELAQTFLKFGEDFPFHLLPAAFADHKENCYSTSIVDLCLMRSIGIPAAIDFTPHYANHNARHYWAIPIDLEWKNCMNIQTLWHKMAKIYRKTYAHQPIPDPTLEEYIPPFFQDPFVKDVTHLYLKTATVKQKLQGNCSNRYAYLAVFNDLQWHPIAWCEIKNRQLCFQNMGKQIVYLPIYYDKKQKMRPLAPPFIFQLDGTREVLDVLQDSVQTMILTRKYSERSISDNWTQRVVGSRFECADTPTFVAADTVVVITQQPLRYYNDIEVDTTHRRRYWRFIPINNMCALAELEWIDSSGKRLEGKIIGKDSLRNKKLFDQDPLTFRYQANWIGMDFGRPISVAKIRYMPINTGNGICPQQEYELLYYKFPEGWCSAGRQIATTDSLIFEQVPAGTLYWLRNHTCGHEERIFTWEKGKARFW